MYFTRNSQVTTEQVNIKVQFCNNQDSKLRAPVFFLELVHSPRDLLISPESYVRSSSPVTSPLDDRPITDGSDSAPYSPVRREGWDIASV